MLNILLCCYFLADSIPQYTVYQERACVFRSDPRDTTLLGTFYGTALADGSVIATDKLGNCVTHLGKTGSILNQFGRRGRGPGEFRGPGAVAATRSKIAVADFASHRIQIFDRTGSFLVSVSAPGPVMDLGFDGANRLWAAALPEINDFGLTAFDPDGTLHREIRLRHAASGYFDNMTSFTMVQGRYLVVGYIMRNCVEVWDTSGRFVGEFTLPFLPPTPPILHHTSGLFGPSLDIPEDGLIRNIAWDGKDGIMILADMGSEERSKEVYCLSLKGTLRQVLILPAISRRIFVSTNGTLYTINEQRNGIRGYRIPALR